MQYVSPSDFVSIRDCPAKAYLLKHSENKLPRSPHSYFYSFCHEFLRKAHGHFRQKPSASEIRDYWNSEYNSLIEKIRSQEENFSTLLPLEKYIQEFPNIRTNIFKEILNRKNKHVDSENREKFSTFREESINVDCIFGIIDFIYQSDDFVKLVDYKFGNIINENNDIKEEYKVQLYIYSAMYYKEYNILPSALSIKDSSFNEHIIDLISKEECTELFEELKKLNKIIANIRSINEISDHANPSDHNCSFCSVKIDCKSYWASNYPLTGNFIDIRGKLKVIHSAYGNNSIEIKSPYSDEIIKILNVPKIFINDLLIDNTYCFISLSKIGDDISNKFQFNRYCKIIQIS
jgi:hypothetical protein